MQIFELNKHIEFGADCSYRFLDIHNQKSGGGFHPPCITIGLKVRESNDPQINVRRHEKWKNGPRIDISPLLLY